MPTALDRTSPIRRHQKVVATVDLPGVPEGTLGKVRVANGFAWYRYWVDFENGVELGHVDHGNLVRAGDWVRFQVERAEASLHVTDEVDDLHQRLVAVGIEMLEPPGDRDYGLRDFSCRDSDGNRLTFSTPLEG